MTIRKYIPSDITQVMRIFHETIHEVNKKDYTKDQLDAWADGSYDTDKWNDRLLKSFAVVVQENDELLGFGSTADGEIDLLYVHKDFQSVGIGGKICDVLEKYIDENVITVWASITAKPFFERRGYAVVKENNAVRNGVELKNYKMQKVRR